LYLYPATIDPELIAAMADLSKVCKYIDMPLQHAHPDVLRAMLRPGNGERYLEILQSFRERIPDLTMRSTFIVGFPGEREEHVQYMEEWIARAQLDRVGFFQYSREQGTPSANLPDQVSAREQRRRLVRLREAQRSASLAARKRRIGSTVRVLVETRTRRGWIGRSMGEAPGVDGAIHFTGQAAPGEFVDVTLERSAAFDFHGRMNHG
jgi:ribosomal protein S12 methylthiotransferase